MKELDPRVFCSILSEMFGSMFWLALLLASIVLIDLVFIVARDRGLRRSELLLAVFAGILGGSVGSWALLTASYSEIADICNFADAVTGLAIWFTCAFGSAVVFYVALRHAGIASNFSWMRLFSNYQLFSSRSGSGELET